MLLVLSPAKSLELSKEIDCSISSIPVFQKEIEPITKVLKKLSVKQIESKFSLSNKLAVLNHERYKELGSVKNIQSARQAIFTFDGDVYVGFDAFSLDKKQFEFTQNTVRILSGLYGVLKPFDLIEPYRLEMGSDIAMGRKKNLYQYWSENVTKSLQAEMTKAKTDYLLNLASNEYFKVINKKQFKGKIVDVDFLEEENKVFKNISFFSKKARGLMARYIVDNEFSMPEDIQNFDIERYKFNKKLSSEAKYIFTRK